MHAPSAISGDRHLRVNGLRLHYRDLGDPGAAPIVFLHGLMGHAYEWDVLLAELAVDHRVVALDQRGHGRSGWAASYRPAAMVADVLDVVDALGLARFHLVGHSMGGMIAMLLAAQRPDLIDRLVIIDVGPDSLDVEWGREELPVALQYLAAASYPTVQDAVDEWLRGDPYASGPLMRHYVEHALRRGEDGRWVWRFDAGRLYDFVVTASSDELRAALDRITAPALLIRGRDSQILTKSAAADVLRRLRSGHFAEIPAGSHDLGVQQPEAVAAAVRSFWSLEA